jgi:hypothetical protein
MMAHSLKRTPLWLWSGLADHLESIEVDAARSSVLIGAPHPESVYYVQKIGLVASADVLRWRPDIRYTVGFRESAWALVHTLASEHSAAFADLLGRLSRGEDPSAATPAALAALPLEKLDVETKKALSGTQVSVERRPIAPLRATIEVRPLDDGELHAQRAEALLNSVRRDRGLYGVINMPLGVVNDEVAAALREDPTQPLAIALDFRATAQDRLARARTGLRERANDFRGALLVWALAYQLAADQSMLASIELDSLLSLYLAKDRSPMKAEMVDALERAAGLAPTNVYSAIGITAIRLARGEVAASLTSAETALRYNPTSPLLIDLYADALSRSGKCTEAANWERYAILRVDDFKTAQGPIFYGHIRSTAGEEMLAGMRDRLGRYTKGCQTGS